MRKHHLTLILVVIWIGLCVWSILAYQITTPSDFGFTRGLNRVSNFLEIQVVAVMVALLAFVLSFRFPPRSVLRWVARGPAMLTLVTIAVFAIFIAFVIWNDPASSVPPPPRPVTEPANP